MAETAAVSFVDLLALETVGDDADKYMSKIPSFNPGMDFFLSQLRHLPHSGRLCSYLLWVFLSKIERGG
jgi:hypothetical protein